ncbi:MAG: endonuclease domain-containing protein [Fimbriimonadaceae bacterium]
MPRNRSSQARDRARELRRTMSATERRLWSVLRRDQLGCRFRRQFPVGPYVLDFFCPERRLCVEVDGPDHDHRACRDEDRDRFLRELGIRTLRIRAEELNDRSDALVWAETIRHMLDD